jgi:hypothetical protein
MPLSSDRKLHHADHQTVQPVEKCLVELTKERMSFTAQTPPFKREKQAKTTRNSSVSKP